MNKTRSLKFGLAVIVLGLSAVIPVLANTQLPDPLPTNQQSILDLVFRILTTLAGIIGIVTFLFLVINGFRMILARDNAEALSRAKEALRWSVAGFIVAILAFSLVASVSTFLGASTANELGNANNLQPPIQLKYEDVIIKIINGILAITALTAIVIIVYSGIRMITSAGNEETVTAAKTTLRWAIVGLLVIVLSFALLASINKIFV